MGNVTLLKEESRDVWIIRWLANLARDLRFAFRTYRKSPGYVAVVVLTLTLGIGVNVALFTVLNTIFWAPPRIHDPARVLGIGLITPKGYSSFSYLQYQALRDNAKVLRGVAAYTTTAAAWPQGTLSGELVTSNYLEVLGARIALGHGLTAADERAANPVMVLSHAAWQREFGANRAILGKTVRLAGFPFTVIGVTASDFGGLDPRIPDFWAPVSLHSVLNPGGWPTANRREVSLKVVGRLAPGISLEAARSALTALAYQLPSTRASYDGRTPAQDYPVVGLGLTPKTKLYADPSAAEFQRLYLPMTVAVALVLLIACANVANILLARAATRRREIAVRFSLGASRARLVRQLLTESSLLAFAAAGLSLLFASRVVRWVLETSVMANSRYSSLRNLDLNVRLDLDVFLYALLVSLITSVAFGLIPALESTREGLTSAMRGTRPGLFRQIRGSGPRDRLVVMQLTACLVLLVGAGLLLRSVTNAQAFNPGFNPANAYDVSLSTRVSVAENARLSALLAERVRFLPQLSSVSPTRMDAMGSMDVIGGSSGQAARVRYSFATPEFFLVLQLPIVRGRLFTSDEVAAETPVAIINEAMAASFWPGQSPLGRRIETREPPPSGPGAVKRNPVRLPGAVEVIGVARDMRYLSIGDGRGLGDARDRERPRLYLPRVPDPATTWGWGFMVRIEGDPRNAERAIRAEAAALNPAGLLDMTPISEYTEREMQFTRWILTIAGLLGVLGLLLATIGLYGIMSYAVTERTQEIGIRIALGAQRGSVLWLILRRGLALAVVGAVLGVPLAAYLTRALAPYLYKVNKYDPLTFTAVPLALIAVCAMAAYLPARRAMRLDPITALRHE